MALSVEIEAEELPVPPEDELFYLVKLGSDEARDVRAGAGSRSRARRAERGKRFASHGLRAARRDAGANWNPEIRTRLTHVKNAAPAPEDGSQVRQCEFTVAAKPLAAFLWVCAMRRPRGAAERRTPAGSSRVEVFEEVLTVL